MINSCVSVLNLFKLKRLSFIFSIFYLTLVTGCNSQGPVKIGFIAGLTGQVADLGIAGRDGATLAVEQINSVGGLQGRPVQLITKNDRQDEKECLKVVDELIAEEVAAIVGPMTSSMAIVTAPLINKHKLLTISPTGATKALAGLNDYFYRVIPVNTRAATTTATYAFTIKKYRNILVVYDLNNRGFTESWYQQLKLDFEAAGGNLDSVVFHSAPGYNHLELAEQVLTKESDCLVLLANAMDTAMISQQLRKLGSDLPIIVSEWSSTEDLLEFGGAAVDGIELFHSFNPAIDTTRFLKFNEEFQKRFGYSANFASVYSYNATQILLTALEKRSNTNDLKRIIDSHGPFSGAHMSILFDKYGDVDWQYTLLKVQDGKIITL